MPKDLLTAAEEALAGRTGAVSVGQVIAAARRIEAQLQPQMPRFRTRMNRKLFALGVPTLALYRALRQEAGQPEAEALAGVEASIEALYRAHMASPLKRKIAGGLFRLPVVQKTIARAAERNDEPGGFDMRRVDAPGTTVALDVHHCPLAEMFAAQGAPEVGPLICKIDDLLADALGVTLTRTGTIAAGAARCDFRYRRKTT